MSDDRTLSIEQVAENVLLVTMNRPDRSNALNTAMGLELIAVFEGLLMQAGDIRCVVLTGAGEKAFCAGGDLKERNGMTDAAWRDQHVVFERMARAILDCPVPVIAAVNGAAYGGGCEIAACCDFIYAAQSARFALTEATLGIIPGAGGTQTIARAVSERRAKELIFSAEPFGAEAAEAWGLVNRTLPAELLVQTAIERAKRIAGNAPLAVRQAKQAIHRGLQMSLADGLAFEIEAYNRLVPTADRKEGVLAFNEKRKPRFEGR
ncbi:Enoyl-CoA hydratase/isomerase family protein [Novosphingobium resinovorum]|uniref:Enoyl-CoA hydratase/isomerase family protein n=2 Tax=Novosphingobium resinovorum TaxID=158500 RepID=A0A031JNK6_9SPHN|nr:Enoyl-CoA hydratase/isomerase family protein [Novosphingobium resinovorum]